MAKPPPLSFDREPGELVEADGTRRILSDDEMAHYWETEARAAMMAGQDDASWDAQAKCEYYKHRARAARKARAAARKSKP